MHRELCTDTQYSEKNCSSHNSCYTVINCQRFQKKKRRKTNRKLRLKKGGDQCRVTPRDSAVTQNKKRARCTEREFSVQCLGTKTRRRRSSYSQDSRLGRDFGYLLELQEHASDGGAEAEALGGAPDTGRPCRQCQQHGRCHQHRATQLALRSRRHRFSLAEPLRRRCLRFRYFSLSLSMH